MLQVNDAVSETIASSPTLSTRHGWANRLLMAVRHFADLLQKHESRHAGEKFGAPFNLAEHYATAAYVLSYSAIEGVVTEVADDMAIAAEEWSAVDRDPILERCDWLMRRATGNRLDKGSPMSQRVKMLGSLRDGLVHPKAEWSTAGQGSKLSQLVLKAKIPLSPFETDAKDAFPLGCMSAGGARWAHDTASDFISFFREQTAEARKRRGMADS